MTECLACLEGRHDDCDTCAWTDLGQPVICSCWARADHGRMIRPGEPIMLDEGPS